MKKLNLKNAVITSTIFYIVIYLTVILWRTFFANPPFFTMSVLLMSTFALPLFLLLNLGFAIFQSQFRIIFVLLSLMILAAPFIEFHPFKITGDIDRRWFFKKGLPEYNQMVDKILTNQAGLTSEGDSFDDLIGRPSYGRTNDDGSIVIQFFGRNGYSRIGYVYYSGVPIVDSKSTNAYDIPDIPGRDFIRLTNNWYEY